MDDLSVIRDKRTKGPVITFNRERQCYETTAGELIYLTFPILEQCDEISHLFTTRLGGVSEGIYSSMNLSFHRGDDPEHVRENYRRIAGVLGCSVEDMVCSRQTHTTNILRVTSADGGKGVTRETGYTDIDGLVTNEPGVALATFYADCVPLYFVDRNHRAIGLAHSGWRGTVQKMGDHMCRRMEAEFGSRTEEMLAAIGPSICRECYEVSEEVAQAFADMLKGTDYILRKIRENGGYRPDCQVILPGRQPGKYQLDLWLANLIILMAAGIPLKNIDVTDICTCHNPEFLFSHRASYGKRGNLGAFLMLKKY